MIRYNIKTSKRKAKERHTQLKVQFLKLYSFPFIENDFLTIIKMLELAGADKKELETFVKDGKFDFNQYARLIQLTEDTIVGLHTQILRMS